MNSGSSEEQFRSQPFSHISTTVNRDMKISSNMNENSFSSKFNFPSINGWQIPKPEPISPEISQSQSKLNSENFLTRIRTDLNVGQVNPNSLSEGNILNLSSGTQTNLLSNLANLIPPISDRSLTHCDRQPSFDSFLRTFHLLHNHTQSNPNNLENLPQSSLNAQISQTSSQNPASPNFLNLIEALRNSINSFPPQIPQFSKPSNLENQKSESQSQNPFKLPTPNFGN